MKLYNFICYFFFLNQLIALILIKESISSEIYKTNIVSIEQRIDYLNHFKKTNYSNENFTSKNYFILNFNKKNQQKKLFCIYFNGINLFHNLSINNVEFFLNDTSLKYYNNYDSSLFPINSEAKLYNENDKFFIISEVFEKNIEILEINNGNNLIISKDF